MNDKNPQTNLSFLHNQCLTYIYTNTTHAHSYTHSDRQNVHKNTQTRHVVRVVMTEKAQMAFMNSVALINQSFVRLPSQTCHSEAR